MKASSLVFRAALAAALAPPAVAAGQVSTVVGGGLTGPNVVNPTSYDLINGSQGSWKYVDYIYASAACGGVCPGASTVAASLSGGLGLLTDGIQAPGGYSATGNPGGTPQGYYVGWNSGTTAVPVVTFNFGSTLGFDVLRIHLEDTQDVLAPATIQVNSGFQSATFTITDPVGREPFWAELALAPYLTTPTSQLELTFGYRAGSGWLMTSEVDFAAGAVTSAPEPATLALVGLGLVGVGAAARRRRAMA